MNRRAAQRAANKLAKEYGFDPNVIQLSLETWTYSVSYGGVTLRPASGGGYFGLIPGKASLDTYAQTPLGALSALYSKADETAERAIEAKNQASAALVRAGRVRRGQKDKA